MREHAIPEHIMSGDSTIDALVHTIYRNR